MKHHTVKFANWLKWNDSSWSQILTISLATSIFVILVVLLLSIRRRKLSYFNISNSASSPASSTFSIKHSTNKMGLCESETNHNWYLNDLFTRPTYCNICECLMVSGVCCIYCNLYADEKCLKKAEKLFKCKKLFQVDLNETDYINDIQSNKWTHHWIKGNLKLNSVCFLCHQEDCGSSSPNLHDYKCCWCWETAHESCLTNMSNPHLVDECNFGNLSRLILQPSLIFYQAKRSKCSILTLEDMKLVSDAHLKAPNWTPLFVFANLKSGNNDADGIIKILTSLLNPLQIVEMNKKNIEMVLKWMKQYSDKINFKILVCGGDGSIGWLLDMISKSTFKENEPAVGILPLGTGNDLSRGLNWGNSYVGEIEIEDVLAEIDKANYVKLDRWSVTIDKLMRKSSRLSLKSNSNIEVISKANTNDVKFMNNYISVGCDALVTLNFHRKRENLFFANRLLNKLIYFKYGTIDTFLKECKHLSENIQLELDGKLIELPHLESIVVLNIPYWGGGVDAWNIGNSKYRDDIPKTSINDGLLEVFGVYSSFHIAQLQVGMAEPYRIGQARSVTIKLLKRFPIQIDGEPWEQNPSVINISFYNQKTMLEKRIDENTHEHRD